MKAVVDADVVVFGDDAFGLFDHDTRFERALELRRDDVAVAQGAFLEDADRGDVGERLGNLLVFGAECRILGREEVEGTDHVGTEPHRERGHRLKADVERARTKVRPSRVSRRRS